MEVGFFTSFQKGFMRMTRCADMPYAPEMCIWLFSKGLVIHPNNDSDYSIT